ncbi:MAG: pyruvate kinase [Oligoflexia bacterium]|nr:pyruvate kinase [Oligoflexia bacterium]
MPSSSRRKVKIVCTLGPSSSTEFQIGTLLAEGMDVARLNFSHGTHEFHARLIGSVREAARKAHRPIAIMQDLQGPKIRVGALPKGGLELKAGDTLLLYPEGSTPKTSTHGKILVPISAEIAQSVAADTQRGARILFDDGKIATEATQVSGPEIVADVLIGGRLTDHKGMNFPGTPLSIPCLTEKDLVDLKFGMDHGVDAIALSFVRSANDVVTLKEMLRKLSPNPPLVVAKIEREEAVDARDSIIEVTDGLLVARGDMAVEIGAERVPIVQKQLIRTCHELGVPVITATQMLESMIHSPTPTRAEASDVANAVFDGTDAIMLSGETASGSYPAEAVRTMSRIAIEAETAREMNSTRADIQPLPGSTVDAIEHSAAMIARHVGAVAIACITHTGSAVRTLSRYRPETPIVAIMDNEAVLRRLSLSWGVRGVLVPKIGSTDDLFTMVETSLLAQGWAEPEDLVVITAGIPTLRRGTTNMAKVHRIGPHLGRS